MPHTKQWCLELNSFHSKDQSSHYEMTKEVAFYKHCALDTGTNKLDNY